MREKRSLHIGIIGSEDETMMMIEAETKRRRFLFFVVVVAWPAVRALNM